MMLTAYGMHRHKMGTAKGERRVGTPSITINHTRLRKHLRCKCLFIEAYWYFVRNPLGFTWDLIMRVSRQRGTQWKWGIVFALCSRGMKIDKYHRSRKNAYSYETKHHMSGIISLFALRGHWSVQKFITRRLTFHYSTQQIWTFCLPCGSTCHGYGS